MSRIMPFVRQLWSYTAKYVYEILLFWTGFGFSI